ncbi:hypothetical protein SPBR_00224 [Sporothrix brasiliensis 5110]|uniref:Ankyrin repeat protein n=1 Tax=Sporothrix brasiliensis 5110 TaxID=1398154 RepID=A0A0C2EVD4_9PEZI|nr:uncharacterized protein SPBR_00224 [Sporothrix brasiliensis 5110]KIH90544.1 hypothetical protein SPBR_00224 [Sporothrix brasiliensis 5110]
MISTDALYKDRTGMRLDDGDTRYFLDDGSSRHDRAAFFTFWSSVSLAKAAKRHRGKDKKKKQQHREKHTTKDKGKERGNDKGKGKSKRRIEASKDGTESPAGKEDLVAAIDRKDYLTVVTLLMSDMSLNDMLEDGTFVLSHAVDDDNSALVSMLAICGADPNVRHRSGNTPLHFASNTDCVASALILLEIGANVDVRDAHGLTPLHVACRERHLSIVLHLLAHGADPNVCDDRGVTPLGYALMHPKRPTLPRELVTTLLTYGARATGRNLVLSPFVESILRYDSTLMGRYLRKTPEVVDADMAVATAGPDGGIVRLRPLYAALLVGNIFAIDLLLRRGADIHHVTTAFDKTSTYLDLAVQSDSTAIVSRLLLANADPNVAAANGRTPLHAAASAAHGELEVVALLLRHGADVHARTTDRHSQALHMAVRAGRADMCFHLLKSGAQVNAPLRSGVTPVMLAVYFNNRSMLRFLMSNGGDVRYKTPQYGETAMHTASRVGDVALAMLLLQHGLSVNAVHPFRSEAGTEDDGADRRQDRRQDSDDDSDGDSDVTDKGTAKVKDKAKTKTTSPSKRSRSRSGYAPIHAAASRGHLDMVRWLLANGADPTARIGRVAARVCLGDDNEVKRQADRKEREGEGEGEVEVASGRPLGRAKYDTGDGAADQGHKGGVDMAAGATTDDTVDHSADHNAAGSLGAASDDDDKADLGATPVEIARTFGHERTAGVIEDAILAASPQYKAFMPRRRSSTSSLSSGDAPPDARGPPPKNKSPLQNSFEPENDSADEGDALAGELGTGKKKVQTPATPPPETSASDGNEHDDDDDVADQEPADVASAW